MFRVYALTNPVYTNFVQQYFSVWAVEKVFIGQKKLCRIIIFSQIWAAEKNNNKNWWKQDSKIRSLIWWAHQWIFLYFFFSLNFQYEIRKYIFFSRVDRRASTGRMSLNQFKLVCLQFKSIFALHENDVCTRTYEFSNVAPLNI